jgi:flagellum-specific peptidoglycan hydrolase FlgJ
MATESQIKFINDLYTLAEAGQKKYGIPAEWSISQWALESNYNKSFLGQPPYYNLFGKKSTKADASALYTWTFEFLPKKEDFNKFRDIKKDTLKYYPNIKMYGAIVKDYFKTYKNYEESTADYFKLLLKPRYKPALDQFNKGGLSAWEYGKLIIKAGYATAPPSTYVKSARNIYEKTILPELKKKVDSDINKSLFIIAFIIGIFFVLKK